VPSWAIPRRIKSKGFWPHLRQLAQAWTPKSRADAPPLARVRKLAGNLSHTLKPALSFAAVIRETGRRIAWTWPPRTALAQPAASAHKGKRIFIWLAVVRLRFTRFRPPWGGQRNWGGNCIAYALLFAEIELHNP
jgi:hypothetical protein